MANVSKKTENPKSRKSIFTAFIANVLSQNPIPKQQTQWKTYQ